MLDRKTSSGTKTRRINSTRVKQEGKWTEPAHDGYPLREAINFYRTELRNKRRASTCVNRKIDHCRVNCDYCIRINREGKPTCIFPHEATIKLEPCPSGQAKYTCVKRKAKPAYEDIFAREAKQKSEDKLLYDQTSVKCEAKIECEAKAQLRVNSSKREARAQLRVNQPEYQIRTDN